MLGAGVVKRVIVSCERASPARAVDSGSVACKQLFFLIRCAHPRIQYLAILPVQKERSQAWDDCAIWPSLDAKGYGLGSFRSLLLT